MVEMTALLCRRTPRRQAGKNQRLSRVKVLCRSSLVVCWLSHGDPVDCLFFLSCSARLTRLHSFRRSSNKGSRGRWRQQRMREWRGGDGRDDSVAEYQISAFPAVRGVLVERREGWAGRCGFLEEGGQSALFLFGTPLRPRLEAAQGGVVVVRW